MTASTPTEPEVPVATEEDTDGSSMHWSDATVKGGVAPVEWDADEDTEGNKFHGTVADAGQEESADDTNGNAVGANAADRSPSSRWHVTPAGGDDDAEGSAGSAQH